MEMIDFERSSHRNVISYAGRTFTLFILLVLALVMGPTLASAQELAATLTGTVTDATGAVLPALPSSSRKMELEAVIGLLKQTVPEISSSAI